jgi:hypothetical protein
VSDLSSAERQDFIRLTMRGVPQQQALNMVVQQHRGKRAGGLLNFVNDHFIDAKSPEYVGGPLHWITNGVPQSVKDAGKRAASAARMFSELPLDKQAGLLGQLGKHLGNQAMGFFEDANAGAVRLGHGQGTQQQQIDDAGRVLDLTAAVGAGGLLFGRAPKGSLGANVATHGQNDPRRDFLLRSIIARANEMKKKPKDRKQPRGGGLLEATKEAYERHPLNFDEDIRTTYPAREVPSKRQLQGGRVDKVLEYKDSIVDELVERMTPELGTATQYFYHTGPIYEKMIEMGYTDDYARKWLKEFSDFYAATSPRTTTDSNLRNASAAMAKTARGIPHRKILGPGTVDPKTGKPGISEHGFPMMTGDGGIHGKLLDQVIDGTGINRDTNTKPSVFSANVQGNLSGVTLDTHAIRGILDALNARHPGSIPPEFILPEFRDAYAENPAALDPATWIADTLAKGKDSGVDKQLEYGSLASIYHDVADKLGVSPAEAQSMGWFGSGHRTGLASERKTIVDLLNDRVDVTAQTMNMEPEEVLRLFFNRQIALNNKVPAGLGLLGLNETDPYSDSAVGY